MIKDSVIPVKPHSLSLINANLQWPAIFHGKAVKLTGSLATDVFVCFLLGLDETHRNWTKKHYHAPGSDV